MLIRRQARQGMSGASLALGSLFCLAAALVPPVSAADSGNPRAITDVRQLTRPYVVEDRARAIRQPWTRHARRADRRRLARLRRSPRSAAYGYPLGRGARPSWPGRSLVTAPQLRHGSRARDGRSMAYDGPGPRRSRLAKHPLMRTPPLRAEIRVEQLLIVPRADGHGDHRLGGIRELGIPVIRDVPPIVIVNPPRTDRMPLEALIRRRTR
jgi:hypothetical protein